jgi:hypothetical protein
MKKQEKAIALKTMAIKARLANIIRTTLFEYSESEFQIKYKGKKRLTQEDKLRIFDEIFKQNTEMHAELNAYKSKRKFKNQVEKLREEKRLKKVS